MPAAAFDVAILSFMGTRQPRMRRRCGGYLDLTGCTCPCVPTRACQSAALLKASEGTRISGCIALSLGTGIRANDSAEALPRCYGPSPEAYREEMHDTDRHALREAVEHIEDAHAQVNRMVANEHEGFAQTDPEYLTPRELHALKQIDADLRSACTRLWDMVERSRDQDD